MRRYAVYQGCIVKLVISCLVVSLLVCAASVSRGPVELRLDRLADRPELAVHPADLVQQQLAVLPDPAQVLLLPREELGQLVVLLLGPLQYLVFGLQLKRIHTRFLARTVVEEWIRTIWIQKRISIWSKTANVKTEQRLAS